jgi:hypothetical protein
MTGEVGEASDLSVPVGSGAAVSPLIRGSAISPGAGTRIRCLELVR